MISIFSIFKKKNINADFFMAICRGSVEGVKEFIEQGADVNSRDDVYFWSKEKENLVFYKKGRSGEDLYSKKCGRTALGYAVRREYTEMVELLCENGADVNIATLRGLKYGPIETSSNVTPLMDVAYNNSNHVEIAKILIAHGAKINVRDTNGETAFSKAVSPSTGDISFDLVKLLVESGADINTKNNAGKSVSEYLFKKIKDKPSEAFSLYPYLIKTAEYLLNNGLILHNINISKEEFMEMIRKVVNKS